MKISSSVLLNSSVTTITKTALYISKHPDSVGNVLTRTLSPTANLGTFEELGPRRLRWARDTAQRQSLCPARRRP